ncbi:MAG: tRNA dihydrouridine(20/20a) synthase DusA [Pseudomonadota bacterium]
MKPDHTYRFCVAPMMDWTDRHCRAFHRTLTKQARLYTEMVTADAVIHGDRDRLIGFDPVEHPVALQLGGADPAKLAEAARIGEAFGYGEINLNCGCPSDRVQSGAFGAVLMKTPDLVAECFTAMQAAVDVPVTVKCRIGVDEDDPAERLPDFVNVVSAAGCEVFAVHARKAWLNGLSPKENRAIPPLDYELVAELKRSRPDLTIVLNGGIESLEQAAARLERFDGVMLGRAAYQSPSLLVHADAMIETGAAPAAAHQSDEAARLRAAVEAYKPYIAARLAEGVPLHAMTRHMLGLFQACPGARAWRRTLSERGPRPGAGLEVVDEALARLPADHRLAAE